MFPTVISTILTLISSIASVYHSYIWVMKPETASLYVKSKMSHLGIELLSMLLGVGGLLLVFPYTFVIGASFLITHSLITIICYGITKDLKGGLGEFILLQIPIFLVWSGYPFAAFEKLCNSFI